MYIRLDYLAFGILFILGVTVLILMILVSLKVCRLLSWLNGITKRNEKNLDDLLITLPKATRNFLELSDDLKNVGEVITETTATAIETKEHIEDYITIFKEILLIVKHAFSK